jgi:ABC-2 type transport system permease protein
MGLVVAEIRKYTTVRTTWILTLVGWALVALSGGLLVLTSQVGGPFGGTAREVADVIDQIGSASVILLVVAVLAMTTEFRHGTVGRTLQLTPSRSRVLAAKLVSGVVYAVVFYLGAVVVSTLVLLAGMVTQDVSLGFGSEVVTALWQGIVGLGLTAMFGVALGALLRNQVVAITVALVWVMVVESLVAQLLPEVGRWLPFQALNALFVSPEMRAAMPDGMFSLLEPMAGLAVFLGYVLVAMVSAGVLLRTRDV